MSVGDGDETSTTSSSSAGTTTSETGTTTTETGSEGEAEATTGDGDGDGDTSTETSTSGDGDGDGDCELYSDPAMGGCCEGEQPLGVTGIDGVFCAPACDTAMMCPASSVGSPQCALMDPNGGTNSCAIVCNAAGDSSDCPGTSTCKDAMMMGAEIGRAHV